MIELPPSEFRFGNRGADIPTGVFIDHDVLLKWILDKKNGLTVIGYSRMPEFKPIRGHIAIMFRDENGNEYWSHIPEDVFSKLEVVNA